MTMVTKKIFLASSYELKDDRREFELFIGRRNKELRARGIVLEVVLWEDFLDAMSKTRLQEEYNRAIGECDIFVMLFCTKVGKYTAEEFETAFKQFQASSKPLIFTYFKRAQLSNDEDNEEELNSLWAFKKKLKALGHFHTPYENTEGLLLHFTQQLDKLASSGLIKSSAAQPVSSSGLSKQQIAQRVTGYLSWLRERTQSIELRGIERAGGAAVVMLPLETAYVPLRARPLPQVGATQMHGRQGLATSGEEQAEKPEPDIALNQVLGLNKRLVIIGGPGCGKTTVLLNVAWALASSLLSGEAEPAWSRLGLDSASGALPLPIFVPLASFARYRRKLTGDAAARQKTLHHFISHHLISKEAGFDLPDDFFVQLLNDGREVVLLLDGLDEVANEDERAEVRQAVEDLVRGRPAMRVLVTCRTVAYRSGGTALSGDFREVLVQPLDPEQHIAPMVRQAYACIYPLDAVMRAERADDLLSGIQRLEQDRRLRLGRDAPALVDSPLMVRLLLIVHVNNRQLPDERAALFDKSINALLQVDHAREASDKRELSANWQRFRDMAQQLAFHIQQQGPDQGRDIDENAARRVLRAEEDFRPHIDEFLSHARQRGSVLEERDGAYRFIHLAFQEFLVARYLRAVVGAESRQAMLDFLGPRLDDPWWREPILLLGGYIAVDAAKSARDFLAALAASGATANARFSAAELAGTAALEWPESGDTIRQACAGHIVDLLGDAKALSNSKAILRARAGDRLAQLGDPRFDPNRLFLPADEALGFMCVAADPEFRIGTRKRDAKRLGKIIGGDVPDYEINDEITPTPAFYIARYPVTVAQFRRFVDATGFAIGDADAVRDADSRPVRFIYWHEAVTYCDWLNGQLKQSPAFAGSPIARLVREEGWRVTLPSELEWEKAARGGLRDKLFSWGDEVDPERANYRETGIGDTSTVGCFQANAFGLHDMLGNVWEWTRSLWGKDMMKPEFAYPYQANDPAREDLDAVDDVLLLVRGGAWLNHRHHARCAVRYWFHPDARDGDLGFRVVLRAAPVLDSEL